MELIDADEFENAVGECLLAISGDEGAAMRQLSANRACWATHPEDYRLTPAAAPIKFAEILAAEVLASSVHRDTRFTMGREYRNQNLDLRRLSMIQNSKPKKLPHRLY